MVVHLDDMDSPSICPGCEISVSDICASTSVQWNSFSSNVNYVSDTLDTFLLSLFQLKG